MKVLYAGDSPIGGAANYLLGILRLLKADFCHLSPSETLSSSLLKDRYDAIILSDFPRKRIPAASERAVLEQVETGTGLLMVGGWASFSGPYGGWKGSLIEKMLPVTCLDRDDRVNFPSGAVITLKKRHPAVRSLVFKNPPVIVGLNEFRPKKDSLIVLTARKILTKPKEYPLLVVDPDPARRVGALATDLAPHWSGGLMDWGARQVRIRVTRSISIEVGNLYVRLVSSLLRWLTSGHSELWSSREELSGYFKCSKDLDRLEGTLRLAKALNQLK